MTHQLPFSEFRVYILLNFTILLMRDNNKNNANKVYKLANKLGVRSAFEYYALVGKP